MCMCVWLWLYFITDLYVYVNNDLSLLCTCVKRFFGMWIRTHTHARYGLSSLTLCLSIAKKQMMGD